MILKKKNIKTEYLDEDKLFYHSLFLNGDLDEIESFLLNKYRPGFKIDQTSAYGGKGSIQTIKQESRKIHIVKDSEGVYTNISIGGTGIWHEKYKKLAKIISK